MVIDMKVSVGVSARHIHLSKEDLEILFGKNYELTKKGDLTQKGQYASEEKVTLKGPKGELQNVRILGPVRKTTQVELAKTDAYKLGIEAPVRLSGDLKDAGEIIIAGPKGEIKRNAAIIAARHLHANYNDAIKYGFSEKDVASLIVGGSRGGVLDNIMIRINDNFSFEVHLDTDEANAFLINNGDSFELKINKQK